MVARPHRATVIEPASTACGLSPRGRRTRRLRVLLVEPEARCQSLLGTGLAEAGFEVVVVPSAEDAHAELATSQVLPHLVIAETELEGSDGFTLCTQLREEPRTSQLPVLLMASRREPFHAELANSVGADDYLPKPVLAQDLVALARLKAGRRTAELSYEAHSARLPLTHIARALLSGARSGRVVLKDSDGFFAFRNGHVVDAAFQGQRGVMAFRRLLAFGSGVYAVFFGPELHRGTLLMDLPFLSQQVLPALERFERLREVGVPLVARLAVEFPKLAEHLGALPEDVISLVRLFDGRRTVRAVLEECRFTEVVAFEAITRLFVLGVLVPASHVEERERVQDPQRLFGSEAAEAWRAAFLAEERAADEREVEEYEARLHETVEREAAASARAEEAEPSEDEPVLELRDEVGTEEDEAPAEETPERPLASVLAFPTPMSRRREEEPGVFNLASGAESSSPHSADKV